jgi:hypothetical protein
VVEKSSIYRCSGIASHDLDFQIDAVGAEIERTKQARVQTLYADVDRNPVSEADHCGRLLGPERFVAPRFIAPENSPNLTLRSVRATSPLRSVDRPSATGSHRAPERLKSPPP